MSQWLCYVEVAMLQWLWMLCRSGYGLYIALAIDGMLQWLWMLCCSGYRWYIAVAMDGMLQWLFGSGYVAAAISQLLCGSGYVEVAM